MYRKSVLQDFVRVWLLFGGCLAGGLALNELRSAPLSLGYASGQTHATPVVLPDGNASLADMERLSESHGALILDARPEIFYRLGHIPSALSLPRDEFEKRYQELEPELGPHRAEPLIVYCSGRDCHDSRMVADALERKGYLQVHLFQDGWNGWRGADLPEEKE